MLKKFYFIILSALILFAFNAYSVPSPTPTIGPGYQYENFATNGFVLALTKTASQLFIGGSFSMIGQRCGSLLYCNYAGNQVTIPRMPQVDGQIYAICKDGNGGYYIGGNFFYVAGQ